jgi:ammonia channel protein AmtB
VIAFLIAKALTGGGRVSEEEEHSGLDLTYHGEGAYGSDN